MANHHTFASPSASATPKGNYNYEVFLNHRGPDVKKTFASHLYRRLLSAGFRVFLDQEEMQEGENITCQIEGAIATASVHVAIFSPRYAESKWCLDELLLMLKSGSTIIPVFYHVNPSELRRTQDERNCGKYAEALRQLEKKKRYEPNTVQKWRQALSSVADISGLELQECNGSYLKQRMPFPGVETNDVHSEIRELKQQRTCRVCRTNMLCILLLPCRHLCVCKDCESSVDNCPLCETAKRGSIEVFMP